MNKNIGDEIKALREQAGLSQTDLAKELNLSKSVVSAYENGSRKPSYNVLLKLHNLLGVSVYDSIPYGTKNYDSQVENKYTIDISDLTPQQQDIIRMTIKQFRKGNKRTITSKMEEDEINRVEGELYGRGLKD